MASLMASPIKSDRPPFSITYPNEWSDRDRMNYLLAPFPPSKPPAQDNPKLSFWSSFILSSSKELRNPLISERELQERFQWNGQSGPKCLGAVLDEMERMGQIMKLSNFFSVEQSSWLWWSVSLLKKPVTWAVKSYLSAAKYEGKYVIESLIKGLASEVITFHQNSILYKSTDSVMAYSSFEELCRKHVTQDLVPLVVQQLWLNGQLASTDNEHGHNVVKIGEKRARVSEVDIGIVRLKDTAAALLRQVRTLEEAINSLKESAKRKNKTKDREGALHLLRQSHRKRSLVTQKEAMLENIQSILHNIQSAETETMVFEAYKSGVQSLTAMQKANPLEKTEDVMADLKEVLEEGEEVGTVISEDLSGSRDEDELLQELLALDQHPTGDELVVAIEDKNKIEADASSMADLEQALASVCFDDKTEHAMEQLPVVPTHKIVEKQEQKQEQAKKKQTVLQPLPAL